MDKLPDPLTPPGCDLSDFQYMELDVRRLRDSKFSAKVSGEAFRAGILLWCAAWHQVPAASLPDDDIELANLAGYGRVVKEWKKVRDDALHGFVKCSDGRLYHKVIAEKAITAVVSKERFTYNKFTDRMRKDNHKRIRDGLLPNGIPTIEQWNSGEYPHGIPPENSQIPPESIQVSSGIPPENALRGNCRGNGTVEGTVEGYVLKEDSSDLLPESKQPLTDFSIPLNDGSEYQVPVKDLEEWKVAFQAIDVEQELRQMRVWVTANPTKRKTRRGVSAFIVRWLSKAQDNPGRPRQFSQSALDQQPFV